VTTDFTEEETFGAITLMELNKPPGLDGFPTEFYQRFWDVIKVDVMAMFTQEDVVVQHETIHELHGKKLDGVIFKIDFWKGI
jgi:hypothetical protein